MARKARPYIFLGQTTSLCETCMALVPAKIIDEGGAVYYLKRCAEHVSPRAPHVVSLQLQFPVSERLPQLRDPICIQGLLTEFSFRQECTSEVGGRLEQGAGAIRVHARAPCDSDDVRVVSCLDRAKQARERRECARHRQLPAMSHAVGRES